jgi:streptomycin 6-kinase
LQIEIAQEPIVPTRPLSNTVVIPPAFAQTITTLYGEAGHQWLADLPILLKNCEQRWDIRIQVPFELTFNYVAPALRADGTPVVVKISPNNASLNDELQALIFWNGHGAVQVLEHDSAQGVMLLERLNPGIPLVTVEDDEAATHIFAHVARQIAVPLPAVHNFDPVEAWADDLRALRQYYQGGTGPLPKDLIELAEGLFAELLPSQAPRVLLHGDLHHWNILSAQRQSWLAVDPQGKIGEPCVEVGAWLRNPIPGLFKRHNPQRLLARRVDILVETLGFDRQRILGWGICRAVLSAWWSIEDSKNEVSGWQDVMQVAEILSELLR